MRLPSSIMLARSCSKLRMSELSSHVALVTFAVVIFHAASTVSIRLQKRSPDNPSSLYQVGEFKPNGSISLRHLALNHENEDVFVGAVNYIFNLDKNLKLKTTAQTGPEEDNGRCFPPIPGSIKCKYRKKLTDNFNKVLLVENKYHRLIACGTLYHGYCERRDLSNIKIRDTPDYGHSVVTNNASASTVAFIAPGPSNRSSLYVSVSYSDDPQVAFDDIPAFASRDLINFSLTHKDTFTETAFKIDTQTKQQFPIYYIYGFGSEHFSYTMAVQKKDEREFHSVIFRVCQNDSRFYSHVEVSLSCTLDNTSYNILQAAAVGKASIPLSNQLGIDPSRDVLYGIFAVAEPFSVKPKAKSAMCIFPMNYVRKVFTENIKRCFNGIGDYGGGHLGTAIKCSVNTEFTINDNYCGNSDSNQPLVGTSPIKSTAVMEFPTSTGIITSLITTVVNNYTVAFVGTKDGNIVKVSLESTSANVYETVPVMPGTPIQPDSKFDNLRTNLFVLTSSKVVKIKVKDCSQYFTCETCLAAKDPYCGWCVLQSKCSSPETCNESDLAKRWLPYSVQECPEIKSVKPMPISIDSKSVLTLDVQNLPEFKNPKRYKCQFSTIDEDKFQPLTTDADRNNNKFQCFTPQISSLPKFENGKDSIDMKLSVLMNNQELVYKKVSFFNCNTHTNCTACTLSQFPCYWCIKNHRCTDSPDNYCQNDDLVASKPDLTNPNASPGAVYCPRFRDERNKTEILVPAGSLYSVKVIGISLYNFQLDNLKCQFHIDKMKKVDADAYSQQGGTYEIVCNPVEFNYVMGRHESQDVPVVISWGQDYPLDNPSNVLVVMYKCSVMAKTCGECLISHAKYACGWCETSPSRCTTEDFCKVATKFRRRGNVCQNAIITKFSPHSGPMEGGTLITINGENLGANSSDIQVTIDAVACELVSFEAPRRIICKTNKANFQQRKGKIDVIVGNQERTQSTESFFFVEPKVMDIFPSIGPQAGGTTITLLGDHLDAGSNVSVVLGQDRPCTQPKSLNASALTCKTSPHDTVSQPMNIYAKIDNTDLELTGVTFRYVQNPNVTWTSRKSVIRSGGQRMNVSGEYLDHVQSPLLLIWLDNKEYSGPCHFTSKPSTNMTCISPSITDLPKNLKPARKLDFGFRMDQVTYLQKLSSLGKMTVYADPRLERFENEDKVHPQNQDLLFIKGTNLDQVKDIDVKVSIGKGECTVQSVMSTVITCKTPPEQPAALVGSGPPEVVVRIGQNLTYNLGVLRYEQQEGLSMTVIIIIAVVVPLGLIVLIAFFIICVIRSLRNDDLMKKMRKEMDQLESRVANECKEAFAELQTNMSELTNDMAGGLSIPFWDYRTYCMRVLFPGCNDHPVIRELELDYHDREDIQHGLKLFFSLIKNKTFLLTFIRTLESRKEFTMKERVKVASLISVALQTQMEYATEVLKVLLAELIEKNSSKSHPQLLLRRNESVAEKMLTNWFTFLLYKFLKECAGEPLFMLYGAIKQQVSNGPVDAVTGEARYSLSEDKLIRQQINFKPMVIHVMDIDVDRGQPAHTVKVLDCDTISQVKEKILDAIFKSAPFSSRPIKEELDLVSFDHPPEWSIGDKSQISLKMFPSKDTKRLLLYDEDNTSKLEGNCKRLNTLSHYKVPDGAYVALHPKQTSIYNMNINPDKTFRYNDNSYYNRSPSLNRSVNHQKNINSDPEGSKVYHLVRHHDAESSNREGERGSKMVSEIYLPRLLVTKGTLQTFVDDLFERIFSTASGGHVLPLAIKYMFDFLDDQAMLHNVSDEVVKNWKSNSLPLRFWVNVIKNPDFAFDIYKSNIVDACLTVIGQTFMDCCSSQEHKLTKDSPSNKLLYAKDIPRYKQWVTRYYEDIKIMPAISDQDMTAMLAEESRSHQNEFNTNAALLELYTYVKTYYDDIANALDEDEFAKKSKLSNKLEQVCSTLDGNLIC